MGCLKAGVVASVVAPTRTIRVATHYRFAPDYCGGVGPESKGMK